MPVPTHRGLARILVIVLIASVATRAEILRERAHGLLEAHAR